ncbi:MAG: ferritin-like domain-containing protein [Clostridia bacterium]|nr:ferritin-like domain-containing protein [Clostridia bacterium]
MTLTQKETSLLQDMKSQEELCIEKYRKYSSDANDPALKQLFSSLMNVEEGHLSTLNRMLGGEEVSMGSETPTVTQSDISFTPSTQPQEKKTQDGYLAKDALSMEKHVSSAYNTAVFEFKSTTMRDTLAHIQKEEQNHGERLYKYLNANGQYN